MADFRASTFPEIGAGGFTKLDGTIEFYGRIRALTRPEFRVLDFGAGRGGWHELPDDDFRRQLRLLRGAVREVVGCDIDPAIATNSTVDQAVVTNPSEPLPFQSGYFDLVIADFVFEHVAEPNRVCSELARVLKPGGWLCARTPNKLGYISILTRLIRNSAHSRALRFAQPGRKDFDVFPTAFRLNTTSAIREHFPTFDNFTYFYQPEPSYHFNSRAIHAAMRFMDRLMPDWLSANLFVFLRKQ